MDKLSSTEAFLIAFLLIGAFFSTAFSLTGIGVVAQQTGTSVGGTLSSDTTWTPEGSPYTFLDTIIVAPGVTLTITPGTVVNLGSYKFLINGTLRAIGNDANRITFVGGNVSGSSWPSRFYFVPCSTPWDESAGSGCIIDHAQFNVPNWQYETVMGGYPKISNNVFYNYGYETAAIRTNGIVVNNTVMGGYRGIDAENGTILYNVVKDAYVGICCGFGSPDPIYHPTIIGNLVVNNTIGIEDWGSHLYITNNTVIDNQVGFRFTSYTFYRGTERKDVNYNNVYGNSRAVSAEFDNTQRTINMAYNWWGTTDVSAIANFIYDKNNQTVVNKIVFTPFLTDPVPPAVYEIIQPLPTPTSTLPEPSISPPLNTTITPKPNAFNIESNSTITALYSNASSGEISFAVNGTTGTTGYVKATIAKAFMPNGEKIIVYLDGNPMNYTLTSNEDAWIITFTYHHSMHQVRISQTENSSATATINLERPYLVYILVGIIAALLALLGLVVWATRKKN